jgi:acyl-CoA thioesterase FadM
MAHYNSFVRIPLLVLRQAIVPLPPIAPLATDTLTLRVWPNDIDFNLHLNNARYLSVMDYGRIHLLARGGVVKPVLKAHYAPVVGSVWITYRRSLPLWARYQLATRLACWDDRWFYMEQIFTSVEGLVAAGWVKGALLKKSTIVPPQQIMDLVHAGIESPPMPESLQILNTLTREKLQSATEPLKSVE